MMCATMQCGRDPRKCEHAVEDNDGNDHMEGLPVRLYFPGPTCPSRLAKEALAAGLDKALDFVRKDKKV